MNKSESIAKLAEALSKAQGAMRNALKDSSNPYFKSNYADLASVSDACRKELAINGLAVSQLPEMRDGRLVLSYILMHSSGEWLCGEIEMNPVKSDPQGIGSAITYARRYSLAAIVGIATEDDDGNAASGNGGKAPAVTKEAITFTRNKESAPLNKEQDTVMPRIPGPVEAAGIAYDKQRASEGADSHSTAAPTQESRPMRTGGVEGEADAHVQSPAVESEEKINVNQQKNFHRECRAAVKPARSFDADNLIYAWLSDHGYKDKDGLPSASMIPAAGWLEVRERCKDWLKKQ